MLDKKHFKKDLNKIDKIFIKNIPYQIIDYYKNFLELLNLKNNKKIIFNIKNFDLIDCYTIIN